MLHFSGRRRRRPARFVLNFYDCYPTTDLSGKILKSLKWDSLQNCRVVAYLCMFYKVMNFVDIVILFKSIKHNYYNHIEYLHSDAFKYYFFVRCVTPWKIIPYHLASKSSNESFLCCHLPVDFILTPVQASRH